MSLNIWIYGSGFGESILLIWDVPKKAGDNGRRAAFIDCYGGEFFEDQPALCQWDKLGRPHVALACVTHPHLDHIQNVDVMMENAGCLADVVLWWGGHDLQRTRAFYDQMNEDENLKGKELGDTAEMAWVYLNDLDALALGIHGCRRDKAIPIVSTAVGTKLIHSFATVDEPIQFYAISPWLGPQKEYTTWIDSQISMKSPGQTVVLPRKGLPNSTSLGFLIQYGKAQVMLGGDIENDNWACFHDASTKGKFTESLPPMNPCLIKVSHHGSSTGQIDGMWEPGRGFFGSLKDGDQSPHCVITPWKLGGHSLPDPVIVNKITKAGCHVWETASPMDVGPIDRNTRLTESFIHLVVDPSQNTAEVVEECFCRHTEPVR